MKLWAAPYQLDKDTFARGVEEYVRQSIKLVDEAEEFIQEPHRLLSEIFVYGSARGDCDDAAVLAATLLAAAGLQVRFVAVRAPSSPQFEHVFIEHISTKGLWSRIDPTITHLQFIPTWWVRMVAQV